MWPRPALSRAHHKSKHNTLLALSLLVKCFQTTEHHFSWASLNFWSFARAAEWWKAPYMPGWQQRRPNAYFHHYFSNLFACARVWRIVSFFSRSWVSVFVCSFRARCWLLCIFLLVSTAAVDFFIVVCAASIVAIIKLDGGHQSLWLIAFDTCWAHCLAWIIPSLNPVWNRISSMAESRL